MNFYKYMVVFCSLLLIPQLGFSKTVIDHAGRSVSVPDTVERIICSGSGCLRLATYLQVQDRVVAVDDRELRVDIYDARPYALANPQYRDLPLFGQFRGYDNPEQIVSLDPQPQLIFKTGLPKLAVDPDELYRKTEIPVVVIDYGDLGERREQLYHALRLMATCLGTEERAESLVEFFEDRITDLKRRAENAKSERLPTVYLGGVAYRGPHGLQSTEPLYPPFSFVGVENLAAQGRLGKIMRVADVSKEKILEWDPDRIFLDLSTLQLGEQAGGLYELRNAPVYQGLTAVKMNQVYGLLPYNWYAQNFDSILANAYFVGKILYPEQFEDVIPAQEADKIFTFLVGEPVLQKLNAIFHGMVYTPLRLTDAY